MKKLLSAFLISILSLFLVSDLFALVDYSEPVGSVMPRGQSRVKAARKNRIAKKISSSRSNISSSSSSSKSLQGMFNITTGFETVDVEASERSGKANVMMLDGHFQTNYSLYLDFSYWYAASSDYKFTSKSSQQQGNPEVILGFNWLRFGDISERAALDLYGGASIAVNNSEFGSSRTDKIFGLETSKRFGGLAIGFGYEYRMTGNPGKSDEMKIGNIQKFSAGLGLVVSSDISFEVEGASYKINASNSEEKVVGKDLQKDISFACISPSLNLGLYRDVELVLGAVFRTKRIKTDDDILRAKLWDLRGAYGNSIFAKLNLSI